jgi:hypothetical protein
MRAQKRDDTTTSCERGSVQHRADASRMVDPYVGLCITESDTEGKWASQGSSLFERRPQNENRLGTAMRTSARTGQSQKVSRQATGRVLRQLAAPFPLTENFVS